MEMYNVAEVIATSLNTNDDTKECKECGGRIAYSYGCYSCSKCGLVPVNVDFEEGPESMHNANLQRASFNLEHARNGSYSTLHTTNKKRKYDSLVRQSVEEEKEYKKANVWHVDEAKRKLFVSVEHNDCRCWETLTGQVPKCEDCKKSCEKCIQKAAKLREKCEKCEETQLCPKCASKMILRRSKCKECHELPSPPVKYNKDKHVWTCDQPKDDGNGVCGKVLAISKEQALKDTAIRHAECLTTCSACSVRCSYCEEANISNCIECGKRHVRHNGEWAIESLDIDCSLFKRFVENEDVPRAKVKCFQCGHHSYLSADKLGRTYVKNYRHDSQWDKYYIDRNIYVFKQPLECVCEVSTKVKLKKRKIMEQHGIMKRASYYMKLGNIGDNINNIFKSKSTTSLVPTNMYPDDKRRKYTQELKKSLSSNGINDSIINDVLDIWEKIMVYSTKVMKKPTMYAVVLLHCCSLHREKPLTMAECVKKLGYSLVGRNKTSGIKRLTDKKKNMIRSYPNIIKLPSDTRIVSNYGLRYMNEHFVGVLKQKDEYKATFNAEFRPIMNLLAVNITKSQYWKKCIKKYPNVGFFCAYFLFLFICNHGKWAIVIPSGKRSRFDSLKTEFGYCYLEKHPELVNIRDNLEKCCIKFCDRL